MKKIASALIAFVLACSMFSAALPTNAEETQTAEQPQIETDITVNGTNSFGNLLSDELTAEIDEQQENNGCNVFSAEVTGNEVLVEFETVYDCTIVAAIYDEEGVQMLSSGSAEVTKDETAKTITIETESMPQYFVVKVFLIDTNTLKPISTSYESSYYTQDMQEILALSTDDFEEEKVLNFDNDKTNNFAVYGENTISAESTDEVNNVLSADEENEIYIIENPDSTVEALQNGDILACEQGNGEVLIVKVESTETDGNKMTIYGQDTSMEEVFDYVKIDSSKEPGESDYDPSTLSEGLTYEGFYEPEQEPKQKASTYAIAEGEGSASVGINLGVNMVDGDNFSIKGSLGYSATFSVKLYLSLKSQFIEFKIDNSLKISLTFTGKIERKIDLGSFDMAIFPGVNVGVIPRFVFKTSVSFETSGTLTATVGFNFEHNKNGSCFNNISKKPNYKDTIKLEGKVEFGFELEPNASIISSKVVRLGFTASVMTEITLEKELYTSEPAAIEKDKYHECENCLTGDIKMKTELSVDLTFLNSKKLKLSKKILSKSIKITDLYFSIDHQDIGFGTCPWQKYRITLVVLGEDMQPFSGAAVKIDDDEETYMTDTGGVVRFYSSGDFVHTVTVTCDGISRTKDIEVERAPKCVYIWIDDSYHQGGGGRLGNIVKEEPENTSIKPTEPAINTPLGAVKEVSLGASHSAAITEDGSLYMWGWNCFGQLENGTTEESLTPIKIMDNVKEVSFGVVHSAAITEDGSLYVWGYNEDGQLGNGESGEDENGNIKISLTPIKIMDNVKSVSLGYWHSAAITEDGSLYMWGWNCFGQLGNGEYGDDENGECLFSAIPIKIMDNVKAVSLGSTHSAAITEDGSLYMWGSNNSGQLGNDSYSDSATPIKIMDNIKSVSLGEYRSGAITEDGSLYMWGNNWYGQLGNGGARGYSATPIKIMDNVKQVSLGEDHSGAITEDGSLYMWGDNQSGQIGNGESGQDENGECLFSSTPIKMMDNVKTVSLGESHSAAITEDGNLYMWGNNWYGQLGNGTTDNSSTPIKINNVGSSSSNTFTLKNDISVLADEETNPDAIQSEFKNLLPNEVYNLYVMKTDTEENLVGSDNLLYIDQYISDADGNITASYIPKEEYEDAVVFLVRMSKIQLTADNTEITAEDIELIDENQIVRPVVMYDGKELAAGIDYDIAGDFNASSVGEHTAKIVGKGNYDGEVEFTYNAADKQECEHEFVDGVCSICGQECEHEFVDGVCSICGESELLRGDANLDGKVNVRDAAYIARMLASGSGSLLPKCADYNEDGVVNVRDAAAIARYLAAKPL